MLALLYDVHGNLAALEAVLDDAAAQGATRYALGGDYCAFGPWPVETLERLDALGAEAMLRGNHERWIAARDEVPEPVRPAVAWQVDRLGPDRARRLAALPATASLDGMLLCHASPPSDMRAFDPGGTGEDEAELLAGVTERRVVFGHTHVQFSRVTQDGVELVNPGSVGLPWDGDSRAAYALVGPEGALELRRVAYDTGRARAALEAIGEPWAARVAAWVEHARFDAAP